MADQTSQRRCNLRPNGAYSWHVGLLSGASGLLPLRGQREAALRAKAQKLLGAVRAQGQVSIAEAPIERDASQDEVANWVYSRV